MKARTVLAMASALAANLGCSATDDTKTFTSSSSSGSTTGGPACASGTVVCDGNVAQTCDGEGGFSSTTDCAPGVCAEGIGCVVCLPATETCEGGVARVCNPEGTALVEYECDPVQGMECKPDGCTGACAPASLGTSYLGCEYWPTVTMNSVWDTAFSFAVALGSTSAEPTKVQIEGPQFDFATELLPYEVKTINLPWVQPLKGPNFEVGPDGAFGSVLPTGNNRGQAYRVRSDRPIAAYQFSPLEYQNTAPPPSCPTQGFGCFSYSNDASLLLPTSSLTGSYYVTGYRTVFAGDLLAITGTADGTTVTITAGPKTRTQAGEGVELTPGQVATVTLGRAEVLQIFSKNTATSYQMAGSRVTASAPVQLITGAPCATVPNGVVACDHLEESVLPAETLGREYAVTVPRTPAGVPGTPNGGRHVVRIHGVHDATALTFDPPWISDVASVDAGRVIELVGVIDDFVVSGSAAFGVTHYMYGQGDFSMMDEGVGAGDPSQSVAIPTAQFRTSYTFVAPTSFDTSFVNIVAPIGVPVEVDGNVLSGASFTDIGASALGVARVQLSEQPFHRASAAEPFGIVVYAYGQYTSYMYPGGMDLEKIEPPIPE